MGRLVLPIALCALLVYGYFGRIDGYPLQDPDEGRYAEIAREMAVSGDWVTPTLNHVRYFDKPPLLYWLVAASFRAFGVSEGVARLVPAAAGVLTVLITFLFGRSMFGTQGALFAAIILATSPLFFLFSQALTTDMVLTACVTATMAGLWQLHTSTHRQFWAVVVSLAAALGVLAKGLVAVVLPGFVALVFLLNRGDRDALKRLFGLKTVAAFLALTAPWFIAVSWVSPEFVRYFFVTQHIERFATASVGHPEGPLFYVPVLLAGALPWTILVGSVVWSSRGRTGRSRSEEGSYLLLWAVTVLLFFSLARSKLPAYILPAFPPLALLGGRYLARMNEAPELLALVTRRTVWLFLLVSGLLGVVAAVAMPWSQALGEGLGRDRDDIEVVLRAVFGAALGVTAVGGLAQLCWSSIRASSLRCVSAVAACAGALLFLAVQARDVVKTSREIGNAVRALHSPGDLVVSYKRLLHGLPFYAGIRPVQAVAYGELDFGSRLAADKEQFFWADRSRVLAAWESGRRVFLVTSRKHEAELWEVLQPRPSVLVRDADRVVLVNFQTAGEETGASVAGQEVRAAGLSSDGSSRRAGAPCAGQVCGLSR